MIVTKEQLIQICPHIKGLDLYILPLNQAMEEGHIDSILRVTAFLGQILHETEGFLYIKEIASGKEYEGRKDLGNTQKGDGVRYKGRGAIQLTGRSNYLTCGVALGLDLINHPELAELPENVFRVATWFWTSHNLNKLADDHNYELMTKKINGGLNGYKERLMYINRARTILTS